MWLGIFKCILVISVLIIIGLFVPTEKIKEEIFYGSSKPADTIIDPNIKLLPDIEVLSDYFYNGETRMRFMNINGKLVIRWRKYYPHLEGYCVGITPLPETVDIQQWVQENNDGTN